jgi:hypothetical protein
MSYTPMTRIHTALDHIRHNAESLGDLAEAFGLTGNQVMADKLAFYKAMFTAQADAIEKAYAEQIAEDMPKYQDALIKQIKPNYEITTKTRFPGPAFKHATDPGPTVEPTDET